MSPAALRRRCLAFSGAVEAAPFSEGLSVFKVAGKIFAICPLGEKPLRLSLKCEPELAEQLRAAYPAITPGYHLNKRHWNTVTIDGSVPDRIVGDMLEDSYDLVVAGLSKRKQRELGWDRES